MQKILEEKVAELNRKDSAMNHKQDDVNEIRAKLQEKDVQHCKMEKEFQMKMEVLLFKDALLQRKEVELTSMEEHVCQLKV